jgi:hypothetical protein
MKTKIKTLEKEKKSTNLQKSTPRRVGEERKYSKTGITLIITMILLIFGYMTYDFFFIKPEIKNKVYIVNQKFDSLRTHLNSTLPVINRAIKTQEEQLKDLQEFTDLYIE